MTDEQFIKNLQAMNAAGNLDGMRQLLKGGGGMARLLAIAARGIGVKEVKLAKEQAKSFIPEGFPDEKAKAAAIAYWNTKRRPDLVARIAEIADEFYTHHFTRNNRLTNWPMVFKTWYVREVNISKPPRDMPTATVVDLRPLDPAVWVQRLSVFHYGDEQNDAGYWSMKWGPKPGQPGCQVPAEAARLFEAKKQGGLGI